MTDIKSLLQNALNLRSALNLRIFYLLIIISLGVMVPLLSFNGNFHIAGGDMTHPEFNISTSIERSMHVWQSAKGLGVSESSTIPALFPYYLSIWFLEFLGFSAGATQKILLIIVFALAGLTMFYLMRTIFPEKKYLHAAFIAALFYLFNFFNLQNFWQPYFNYQLAYAMTPFLLGVYVKGLTTGDRKYLCYFILVSFLNASSALNYALIAVQLLILLSYTLWAITFSENRTILAKRILQYGTAFVAASSFWLIPTIAWYLTASQSYGQGWIIAHNLEGQISLTGQYGIPINTFRLWGFPWFFKDGLEWSYPMHIPYTQNALLILLSFIPALLTFLAIILMRKKKEWHRVLFFSILVLVGFFMMKGTAPPFGEVFRWLLDNNGSFLSLFKNPVNKFGIVAVMSSAVLIGLAVNEIATRAKRKSTLFIIIFLASSALSGLIFPYWTGEAVRSRFKVDIPSAYSGVAQYLNSYNSSLKVLPLPLFTVNNFKAYKWGYSGAGVDQYFIQNSLVDRSFEVGSLETEKAILLLRDAINMEDATRVVGLCRQYGIGWIVYHNDADPTFYNEDLHLASTKRVLNTPFFVLEKSFSELSLYKIADSIPQLYSPDRIVVYPSDGEPLNSYRLVDNKTKKPMFISNANLTMNKDRSAVKIESVDMPKLDFTNISPTKYLVNISGATAPYYLVLSESFNPNWKVYVVGENKSTGFWDTLFGNALPEENHLKVNGYANGWTIDPEYIKQNFSKDYYKENPDGSIDVELTLYFKPQSYFYLGIIISITTLLGCLGYLGYDLAKRRKRGAVLQTK
ncbi:MAG: alpha-(1-_3)-arabinofuranosyltransferase family protein [Parcubacteria group bacterium]